MSIVGQTTTTKSARKQKVQATSGQRQRLIESRARRISASIVDAIARPQQQQQQQQDDNAKRRFLARLVDALVGFLSLYRLRLTRYRPEDFLALRRDVWQLDEADYADSFITTSSSGDGDAFGSRQQLRPAGPLGYSGSTFFTTANHRFLVKSLPRRSEHTFTHDLFDGYAAHMRASPGSLLVRIVDMVVAPRTTLGGLLGTAPTHHIVMENLLHGAGDAETYDLKPDNYFYPERDIAEGRLAPDSVNDRLVDTFPDRVRVSAQQKRGLLAVLDADTALLAAASAVDYSLFLVRFPSGAAEPSVGHSVPKHDSCWRAGLISADGCWTYRALVLDLFWAKNKARARAMTGLVKAFDWVAHKGPMSITAQPDEYRARFLSMVDKLVVATVEEECD